jgi:hypothetical protein
VRRCSCTFHFVFLTVSQESGDNSVDIATRPGVDDCEIGGSRPGRGSRFFSSTLNLESAQYVFNAYRGFFYPGSKWPGRKTRHSTPSTAEVNE